MNSLENPACRFAHDLRNILTAVQGNTELLTFQLPQHSFLHQYLRNILIASERGHELLAHILNGTSHQDLAHEELDLRLILNEVVQVFCTMLPATIRLEKIDRLSTSNMIGHSTQLFRMLSNLISNAVQAMHGDNHGCLTIIMDNVLETDPLPFDPPNRVGYIKIIVQDTGSGMSADLCQKIFNPYFTTHQDREGMGVGLAIVKDVVKDHNGVVMVESEPRQGSTFTVYLPQNQGIPSHTIPLQHPLSACASPPTKE